MPQIAIITGSAGLVGSELVRFFAGKGCLCVGLDNDMRREFFGAGASTEWNRQRLLEEVPGYVHHAVDVRDEKAVARLFDAYGTDIRVVLHTASQPSHDWAAREPVTDFTVNANGTLNLLEQTRRYCPRAPFLFTSTNKVYGDHPNHLPLVERETRWEVEPSHPFAAHGIDETMSIDGSMHSLFGVSKAAGDLLVQEYGRYFGMPTVALRCGCITGPNHSGAQLHGFLSYLMKCALSGERYTIFGYKGKQVRDNLHSRDLAAACHAFYLQPRPGAVYNLGGGRANSCSVLEAVAACEELAGKKMQIAVSDQARAGDHIWYISDVRKFQNDYPNWRIELDLRTTLMQMFDAQRKRPGTAA